MSTVLPLLYPPPFEALTTVSAFQAKYVYVIGFKVLMIANSMQV